MITVFGCSLFVLGIPPIPDHAYQFHLGSRILDGARLYVDVAAADMHPPLFTWLAAAVVAAAGIIGCSAQALYVLVVVVLCAAAIWGVSRLERRWPLLLMGIIAAVFPLAGPYFGQGEHLALVLSLPYLFASAAQVRGRFGCSRTWRAIIAVAAAFGLAMKPHFALLWAGTELYVARQRGWRSLLRIECLVILTFFLLYVAATVVLTPQLFDLMPWVTRLYPRYVAVPLADIIFDWRSLLLLAGIAAGWSARRTTEIRALADLLMIAALAMFAVVVLQMKDWGYHWYPVCAFALILIVLRLRDAAGARPAITAALALIAVVGMFLQVERTRRLLATAPTFLPALYDVVVRYPPGTAILGLSQYIQAGFPLTRITGSWWVSPYAHLWMVPAIHGRTLPDGRRITYTDEDRWSEVERAVYDRVWAAMQHHRPGLVIIERPVYVGVDMRAYFARDPRFREYFNRLRLVDTIGFYSVYDTLPSPSHR